MGLLDSIVKSISETIFPTAQGQFYPLTNTNYRVSSLNRSDYIRLYTGWQYLCVSTIANSVAELDYILTRNKDDDKAIDHKHFGLIDYRFLQTVVSSLQLTGSAYFRKVMIGAKIDELQYLRTDLVELEENSDGSLRGYRYTAQNGNYLFHPSEILDFSLYSPLQSYPHTVKGVSPMQAVAMQAELDQTATRWNWNFFKNNASIGGILKTDKSIDKDAKARAIRSWKEKYQGVNNSNSIAFLDNGVQYEEIKVSQKELDFVESRRFTRDEVFAIFKVPKAIVGVTDDVNRATAQTAESIFYRITISPLAVMIEEKLNKELFKGIGYFQFTNINPVDKEDLLKEYNDGGITLNEYRKATGRKPLVNGDFVKLNPLMVDSETQYSMEGTKKSVEYNRILHTLNKNTKGTDEYKLAREEYGQKLWEAKINRTDVYESEYIKIVNKIFKEQEQAITEQIRAQKGVKIRQPKLDLLTTSRWIVGLKGLYTHIFQIEGNEGLNQVGVLATFDVGKNKVNKWINDSIALMSKQVNNTTEEYVGKVIKEGNDLGLGAEQIARNISKEFEDFTKERSLKIARTEITNASTEAYIQSWEESGVVQGKEWYTALDERVCPECNRLHTEKTDLRGKFINGKSGPTEHPNCRCTILAITE